MQARLEIQRFSVVRILVAFGVAAALLIGLQLGYALKATTVISGPSRVVVVSAQPSAQDDNRCVFINRVKAYEAPNPSVTPTRTKVIPCLTTSVSTSRVCAPSVILMPISCVRCDTL